MGRFDKLVEEKLREAIAAGEFDNLRGKGQPQDLRVNPYVHPDDRMAQDMLHAHGYSLPWIEERRDLLRDRELLVASLERNLERQRRERAIATFRREAEALNARIRSHNLTVPVVGMRVALVDVEKP